MDQPTCPLRGVIPQVDRLRALACQRVAGAPVPPLLLSHHPLASPLAERYLAQLETATGGRTLATPYSAPASDDPTLSFAAPALPLVLAANRLTERLGGTVGVPLLQRPALRTVLLNALEALP